MAWTSVLWTPTVGQHPSPHGSTGSKHARQTYDSLRGRHVISGGDRDNSDAGQPNIYSFVAGSGNFSLIHTTTASGKQPAYPDNCTWAYDSQHDKYLIARSFWFGLSYAQSQQPTRPAGDWLTNNGIYDPVTNEYSATVIPTPPGTGTGWGGDSNDNFGVYDPVLNALLRLWHDGAWGFSLQIIPMGDLTTFPTPSFLNIGSGYASGSFMRNYLRNIDAHSNQPALDVINRKLYVIAKSSTTMLPAGDDGWGLIQIDLTNPQGGSTRIELPDDFDPQEVGPGDGFDNYLCFDSLRNAVMHPQVQGYGGEVKSTIIYHVNTQTWETVASNGPPYPHGNCFSYDPVLGAGVLTGGRATTSVLRPGEPMPTPTSYFLLTPGTEPPAPEVETIRVTAGTCPLSVPSTTVAGFYRFTRAPAGGAVTDTVDTANPTIKFGDFPGTEIGVPYDFTGVLRNQADNADIGTPVTVTITFQGTPPDPPPPDPVDTTPPDVTIVFPANDEEVSGTIAFNVEATDDAGILLLEYRVNGALLSGSTFDTTTLPNGTHTFSARAVDNSDNANETTETVSFVINNVAPPDPPDPPPATEPKHAILVDLLEDGRLVYLLWVPVPPSLQVAPNPPRPSQWSLVSAGEQEALDTGEVREVVGTLALGALTIDDIEDILDARWAEEVAKLERKASWIYDNSYSTENGWVLP